VASWTYVAAGFALTAAGIGAYAAAIERRIRRLRSERREHRP
jgi:hypothetical protein